MKYTLTHEDIEKMEEMREYILSKASKPKRDSNILNDFKGDPISGLIRDFIESLSFEEREEVITDWDGEWDDEEDEWVDIPVERTVTVKDYVWDLQKLIAILIMLEKGNPFDIKIKYDACDYYSEEGKEPPRFMIGDTNFGYQYKFDLDDDLKVLRKRIEFREQQAKDCIFQSAEAYYAEHDPRAREAIKALESWGYDNPYADYVFDSDGKLKGIRVRHYCFGELFVEC